MTAVIPESSEDETDGRDTLQAVGESALRLLAGFPSAPTSLRIQVGEVTVEAEWPHGEQVRMWTTAETLADIRSDSPSTADTTESDPAVQHVVAPMVGVFYRAPEPGAEPFVDTGDKLKKGDQVGIVEAMKLMVPVHAEESGTVTEILVENGEGVEYGQKLLGYTTD